MEQEITNREMGEVEREVVGELETAISALYRASHVDARYLARQSALYLDINQAKALIASVLNQIEDVGP